MRLPSFVTPRLFSAGLVAVDLALCVLIILRVPYTEIDWTAYMEQVGQFLAGERDYSAIRGGTGPLVYPAGFLYVFTVLEKATGGQIPPAQWIFASLYILTLATALALWARVAGRANLWGAALLCASRRIHSIFVLRLFNDGVENLFAMAAVLLFSRGRWRWGCLVYSLAVSIKMNALLYAPALLVLLLQHQGLAGTALCLTICAAVQVVLGLPFLLHDPVAYLTKAFELSRVFFFKWTVNWRFLPEDVFVDSRFGLALLLCHVAALALYLARFGRVPAPPSSSSSPPQHRSSKNIIDHGREVTRHIVTTLFAANLIGISFSRTLHYQFYAWYWFTLPFLLWSVRIPTVARLGCLLALEWTWNVYPSTSISSAVLHAVHIFLLIALFTRQRRQQYNPSKKD
jgi:alpha-1,3-mannosyltransferase